MQSVNKFPTRQAWLLDCVTYFRQLSFFGEYQSLSSEELATTVENLYKEEWGQNYDPLDTLGDLLVIKWDESRVWWQDTEADVCSGNSVYEGTLREWGVISRDAFTPEDIHEDWASEDGPVTVTFAMSGQAQKVTAQVLDDYIDVAILSQINRLISNTGVQFAIYKPFDQTAFIVALTQQEKLKLERERGWQFAKL